MPKRTQCSDRTADTVNRLVQGASILGIFAMGMATGICLERGVQPDESLLWNTRETSCVEGAQVIIDRWFEVQSARRRKQNEDERDGIQS